MQEISPHQASTALSSPSQLKAWLEASQRRWLVFDALDLVDALPWPHGVEALMQICQAYKDHRSTQPSGEMEVADGPTGPVAVPVMKSDGLELEELDRAVRYLVAQILERDPSWKLGEAQH